MGCTLSLLEIKESVRKPVPIMVILANIFVLHPLWAVCSILILDLNPDWALGALCWALTPPTTQGPIASYVVGGKPAVALTSSVLAMALAIVLMPAAFSGYVALLNSLRAS